VRDKPVLQQYVLLAAPVGTVYLRGELEAKIENLHPQHDSDDAIRRNRHLQPPDALVPGSMVDADEMNLRRSWSTRTTASMSVTLSAAVRV